MVLTTGTWEVLGGTWKPEIHTTIWARCVVRSQARFDGPLLHSLYGPNTIMNPTVWFSFFFLRLLFCLMFTCFLFLIKYGAAFKSNVSAMYSTWSSFYFIATRRKRARIYGCLEFAILVENESTILVLYHHRVSSWWNRSSLL